MKEENMKIMLEVLAEKIQSLKWDNEFIREQYERQIAAIKEENATLTNRLKALLESYEEKTE